MKPDDFIAALSAPAVKSMQTTKIPASFVIAEGALESGWGGSKLALEGFNLFGVKADASWTGDVVSMPTREYLHGQFVVVNALWRKYADWQACIDDHAKFLLKNDRYRIAFGRGYNGVLFAQAIAAAGYATDVDYGQKVSELIYTHGLLKYDQQGGST